MRSADGELMDISQDPEWVIWDRRHRWWWWAGNVAGVIGILGTLVCAIIERNSAHKIATSLWWFGWAVIPPAWFLLEYWYSGPSLLSNDPEMKNRFDQFKYSQDVSAKLWLGIVTALGAFIQFGPHSQ
jgi:hypothetical protein